MRREHFSNLEQAEAAMIKARDSQTKVIVITAYGSEENKEQALRRGADNYLEKPFDLYEIKFFVTK